MDDRIDRYQSALSDVEALVLDCFAGYRGGRKTAAEIVAEIRDVGADIRAAGDPTRVAALDEIMQRPIRAWRAIFDGPVDSGLA